MSEITKMPRLQANVLALLLDGDYPMMHILRTQLNMAGVESLENTGSGFFMKFSVPKDAPVIPGKPDFQFGDVDAQVEGLKDGAGFVVFVRDGQLRMLEGYSYEEPWPEGDREFTLSYSGDGKNRLEKLIDLLGADE